MISQQLPEYLQKIVGEESFNIEIKSIDVVNEHQIQITLSPVDSIDEDVMNVAVKDLAEEDAVKGMIYDTMFAYSI